MEDTKSVIKRIEYFEKIYDNITNNIEKLENLLDEYEENLSKIKELEEYYSSEIYMRDYILDEQGKIPTDIKRGILSEDGIYDLLIKNKELKERLKKIK